MLSNMLKQKNGIVGREPQSRRSVSFLRVQAEMPSLHVFRCCVAAHLGLRQHQPRQGNGLNEVVQAAEPAVQQQGGLTPRLSSVVWSVCMPQHRETPKM